MQTPAASDPNSVVPTAPSPAAATPTHKGPVGKKELLKWASDISQLPVKKLEDLKDGAAIIKLFAKVWPRAVDLKRLKWKVRIYNYIGPCRVNCHLVIIFFMNY